MADGWFQRLTRILRIGSGWLRDRRNTGATVARDVLGRSDPASSQILDPPQPPRRQPAAPPQPADRGMRPASPPAASPPRELAVTKIESDEDEA
jgi:hypothetical protein